MNIISIHFPFILHRNNINFSELFTKYINVYWIFLLYNVFSIYNSNNDSNNDFKYTMSSAMGWLTKAKHSLRESRATNGELEQRQHRTLALVVAVVLWNYYGKNKKDLSENDSEKRKIK